jgi:hypothetical protein
VRSLIPMFAVALALSGCTRPAEPAGAALARELAGHVAGQPQLCVSRFGNQNLRAIDARTLAYGSGRTIYVNHLPGDCPGLSVYNTIIAETQGSEYCRGDRVRGLEPGGIIPGPTCNLGDWIPYRMR